MSCQGFQVEIKMVWLWLHFASDETLLELAMIEQFLPQTQNSGGALLTAHLCRAYYGSLLRIKTSNSFGRYHYAALALC